MLDDWLVSLKAMENTCRTASTIEEGIKVIYYTIREYISKYEPIWNGYKGMPDGFRHNHTILRNQLSNLLVDLLELLGRNEDLELCPLLSETILACATQKDIPYSTLSLMSDRLFP